MNCAACLVFVTLLAQDPFYSRQAAPKEIFGVCVASSPASIHHQLARYCHYFAFFTLSGLFSINRVRASMVIIADRQLY